MLDIREVIPMAARPAAAPLVLEDCRFVFFGAKRQTSTRTEAVVALVPPPGAVPVGWRRRRAAARRIVDLGIGENFKRRDGWPDREKNTNTTKKSQCSTADDNQGGWIHGGRAQRVAQNKSRVLTVEAIPLARGAADRGDQGLMPPGILQMSRRRTRSPGAVQSIVIGAQSSGLRSSRWSGRCRGERREWAPASSRNYAAQNWA